jgi:hypothetical protein
MGSAQRAAIAMMSRMRGRPRVSLVFSSKSAIRYTLCIIALLRSDGSAAIVRLPDRKKRFDIAHNGLVGQGMSERIDDLTRSITD